MNAASWRRELAALADDIGAVVERRAGGHLQIRHLTDGWRVIVAASPSDHRAFENARSTVYRMVRASCPHPEHRRGTNGAARRPVCMQCGSVLR